MAAAPPCIGGYGKAALGNSENPVVESESSGKVRNPRWGLG